MNGGYPVAQPLVAPTEPQKDSCRLICVGVGASILTLLNLYSTFSYPGAALFMSLIFALFPSVYPFSAFCIKYAQYPSFRLSYLIIFWIVIAFQVIFSIIVIAMASSIYGSQVTGAVIVVIVISGIIGIGLFCLAYIPLFNLYGPNVVPVVIAQPTYVAAPGVAIQYTGPPVVVS